MEATIIDADWIPEGFAADDAPLLHNDAALVVVDGRVCAILPRTEAEIERRQLARDVFPHVRKFYDGDRDGLGDDSFYCPSGRF